MIYPTRPIKENSLSLGFNYYDNEMVVQEDGRIASFFISKNEELKGWVFSHYEDKFGFTVVERGESSFLLEKIANNIKHVRTSFLKYITRGKHYDFNENIENFATFSFGGALSKREGIVIYDKFTNDILRYKIFIIS